MHRVPGAFCYDVALDAAPSESEVTDQVEDLVADELIGKTQRAIFGPIRAKHDGVLGTCAANQTHVAQLLFVSLVAKGASAGDLGPVCVGGQIDAGLLFADGGWEVDGVLNPITGAGIDGDEFVAFANLDGLQHAHVFAAAALGANALL